MSFNTPNQDGQKYTDAEMANTQADSVSPFISNQSPGSAQFKMTVNVVPGNSVTNLDMVCDTGLTESRKINGQTDESNLEG